MMAYTRVRNAEFSNIILESNNQYEYVVENYLHNLRDVKNFAMSFTMAYETISKNTDWIKEYNLKDLFWLEIMHFSYGKMYDDLKDGLLDFVELSGYNSNFPRYVLKIDNQDYLRLNRHQKQLFLYLFDSEDKGLNRLANFIDFPKYFQMRLPKRDMPMTVFKGMINGNINISEYLEERHAERLMPRRSLSFYLNIQRVEDGSMSLDMMKRYVDVFLKWASLEWHEQPFARIIATKLPFDNEPLMFYLLGKLKAWGGDADKLESKDDKLRIYIQVQFFIKGIYQKLKEIEVRRNKTFSYFYDANNGLQTLLNENYVRFITLLPLNHPLDVISGPMNAFLTRSSIRYRTGSYFNNFPEYEMDNIIIHKIIDKFSWSPSNDYQKILSSFDLKQPEVSEDLSDQMQPDLGVADEKFMDNISNTFGSADLYKEFLQKCFNIPKKILEGYYSRVGI